MWGQPPSAVQASALAQGFLSNFPELKLGKNLFDPQTPSPYNSS
jgi:hypothetical protein